MILSSMSCLKTLFHNAKLFEGLEHFQFQHLTYFMKKLNDQGKDGFCPKDIQFHLL
jgi:hypothetical protein